MNIYIYSFHAYISIVYSKYRIWLSVIYIYICIFAVYLSEIILYLIGCWSSEGSQYASNVKKLQKVVLLWWNVTVDTLAFVPETSIREDQLFLARATATPYIISCKRTVHFPIAKQTFAFTLSVGAVNLKLVSEVERW